MAEKKKKRGPGRPAVNAPNLTKRWQIRCDPKDHALWAAMAEHESLGDPSTLARKVLNDHAGSQLEKLSPQKATAIRMRADQILKESRE